MRDLHIEFAVAHVFSKSCCPTKHVLLRDIDFGMLGSPLRKLCRNSLCQKHHGTARRAVPEIRTPCDGAVGRQVRRMTPSKIHHLAEPQSKIVPHTTAAGHQLLSDVIHAVQDLGRCRRLMGIGGCTYIHKAALTTASYKVQYHPWYLR